MIPKILEYEDGRIKVTAAAYALPEIKDIIDKYDSTNLEAYLTYIHGMAAIDSPYANIPDEEKQESIIYDINETLGEFDYDDPLVTKAIHCLIKKYESPIVSIAREMEQELHRFRILLRDTPLDLENFKDRMTLMEKIDKIATSYSKVRDAADKEMKVATKGDHELGEY